MTEQKNSSKTTAPAQALLLEQVEFQKQLSIENSPIYFRQFIQLFIQHADEIKLYEVVDLEQLQAVVKRYAFEMQLGAGLLEFIGEIAQRIYLSAMKSQFSYKTWYPITSLKCGFPSFGNGAYSTLSQSVFKN